jgi:hypothetical protein
VDDREALVAKEAGAAAALRSIDRLVPAGVIVMVGCGLATALFPRGGLLPLAMIGMTTGVVIVILSWTRRAHLAVIRRQLKALEPPPLPPARVIR